MSDDEFYDSEGEGGPQEPVEVLCRAKVVYPFEATNDVELDLDQGETIDVTRMDVGGGWWEGMIDGVVGLFPEGYVSVVEDEGAPAAAAPDSGSEGPITSGPVAASRPAAASASRSIKTPGSHVVLPGTMWEQPIEPFAIEIKTNSTKGSKFSGLKQFTTYQISTSSGSVHRRFKHFAWLHARLKDLFPNLSVPPLPDKQVQGRFDQSFIENRRRMLQRFCNRVAKHPVLGSSSVFRHFLTATDQKDWKSGKRRAEQEATVSTFLTNVSASTDNLPADPAKSITDFAAFSSWLDKQIAMLQKTCDDLLNHEGGAAAELTKFGGILTKMQEKQAYDAWWPEGEGTMQQTMETMAYLGGAFDRASALRHERQDQDRDHLLNTFKEYHALTKTLGPLVKSHEQAQHDVTHHKETADVPALEERLVVVQNVVLSELRHFHENLSDDLYATMRDYVAAQVEYHAQASEIWQGYIDGLDGLDG